MCYWVQACVVKVLLNLIRRNFALKCQPKEAACLPFEIFNLQLHQHCTARMAGVANVSPRSCVIMSIKPTFPVLQSFFLMLPPVWQTVRWKQHNNDGQSGRSWRCWRLLSLSAGFIKVTPHCFSVFLRDDTGAGMLENQQHQSASVWELIYDFTLATSVLAFVWFVGFISMGIN